MFSLDPSKMDPKVLMELSALIQQLPPAQLQKMQTLMHNTMAGFDTRKEMEEFERSLPPGFKEKIAALMMGAGAAPEPAVEVPAQSFEGDTPMGVREARMTILRAIASGKMTPEEAEKLLF